MDPGLGRDARRSLSATFFSTPTSVRLGGVSDSTPISSMETLPLLSVTAVALFRREDTEINPVSATNRKLVISGPYRFTRNPMYLGLVAITLGIAFWIGAWPMFLAPIAVFATANWMNVPFEEAKMRRQFGAEFDAYVRRVRRWI